MLRNVIVYKLHNNEMVAAQLAATLPGRTAWVGIYPLQPSPSADAILRNAGVTAPRGPDSHAYNVRMFEISDDLVDKYFGEDELENKRNFVVIGDDALFLKLEELNIPISIIDSTWRVDYPL
jgi:hypothetical protein